MKLTKEQVYVKLQDKTKEELTDLYNFLKESGDNLEIGLDTKMHNYGTLEWYRNKWFTNLICDSKIEVTIDQLKEIIKPTIKSLSEQLKEAKRLVAELEAKIKENEPKIGDVCKFWDKNKDAFMISVLDEIDNDYDDKSYGDISGNHHSNCEKITDEYIINYLKTKQHGI